MQENENLEILDEEIDGGIEAQELTQVVEVEEVVEVVGVTSIENEPIEASDDKVEVDDRYNHALLFNRELHDQHPISSITRLREELDSIEALQIVYSNEKGVADYYQWEDGNLGMENRVGYFVSIAEDGSAIKLCTGPDIYGVVVDDAAFVGGQDDIVRDYKYGLVAHSGIVKVRCELDVEVGDYVISNTHGYAQKASSEYGCKVVAIHEIAASNEQSLMGARHAVIMLNDVINQMDTLGASVRNLDDRLDAAETNIVSAVNVANQAYNKAHDIDKSNQEVSNKLDGTLEKVDNMETSVKDFNELVTKAATSAAQAKAIAESAVTSAAAMKDEAVAKANEALVENVELRGDFEKLILDVNERLDNVDFDLDQRVENLETTTKNLQDSINGAVEDLEDFEKDLEPLATWTNCINVPTWEATPAAERSPGTIYYSPEIEHAPYLRNDVTHWSRCQFSQTNADKNSVYYVEALNQYWYYANNKWNLTSDINDVGIIPYSYAGFVARADKDSATLASMVKWRGDAGESLAGFVADANKKSAYVASLASYELGDVVKFEVVSKPTSGMYYKDKPIWDVDHNIWMFTDTAWLWENVSEEGTIDEAEAGPYYVPINDASLTYYQYSYLDGIWSRAEIGKNSSSIAGVKSIADANKAQLDAVASYTGTNSKGETVSGLAGLAAHVDSNEISITTIASRVSGEYTIIPETVTESRRVESKIYAKNESETDEATGETIKHLVYSYYLGTEWHEAYGLPAFVLNQSKVYYVVASKRYWYNNGNGWNWADNPYDAGLSQATAGLQSVVDDNTAQLDLMASYDKDGKSALAGITAYVDENSSQISQLAQYKKNGTNDTSATDGVAGLIAQVSENTASISQLAKLEGEGFESLGGLVAQVDQNKSDVALVSRYIQGNYTVISDIVDKDKRDEEEFYYDGEKYWYYNDEAAGDDKWIGVDNFVNLPLSEDTIYYVAGTELYWHYVEPENEDGHWTDTTSAYDAGLPSSIGGIQVVTDKNSASIDSLASWQGDTNSAMARIEQKADANGAYIQSTVSNMDKYSVGPHSQAYGFTLEQAASVLEESMIYVPTESIAEEYNYTDENGEIQVYTRTFTPQYLYKWGKIDGQYRWITVDKNYTETDETNTSSKAVYFTPNKPAVAGNFGYWYTDGDTVTEGYAPYTLYKWESYVGENGATQYCWVAVATLAGNSQSRAVSQIRQDTNSIEFDVTNVKGDMASIKVWAGDDFTAIQDVVSWKDSNAESIATTIQKATDSEAYIAQVASVKNDDGTINAAASIVTAVNDSDSSVVINASHIQLDGVVSFVNSKTKALQNNAVYSSRVEYALSQQADSFEAVDDAEGQWSTTAPTWRADAYMWQRIAAMKVTGDYEVVEGWNAEGKDIAQTYYSNGDKKYYYYDNEWKSTDNPETARLTMTTSYSGAVCIQGAKGTGITIKGVAYIKDITVNDDIINTEHTLYKDETLFTQITDSEDGDSYLVQGYLFVYSGTENKFTCVGKIQGPSGDTGIGVSSVINYYMASSRSTGVVTGESGWLKDDNGTVLEKWVTDITDNDYSTMSASKPYLWNYEVVKYTSYTKTDDVTTPVIIGNYSEDGKGIEKIEEFYLISSSNSSPDNTDLSEVTVCPTVPQEDTWYTTPPVTDAINRYLWNCERITYTNGDPDIFEPALIGTHGDSGISPVLLREWKEYAVHTSNATAPTTGWNTEVVGYDKASGKIHIWTHMAQEWDLNGDGVKDGETFYTEATYDSSITSISAWCKDNNITMIDGASIATGTIDADQINSNAVTADKLAANAVTADKIDVNDLSAISANLGTVTSGLIKSPDYDEPIVWGSGLEYTEIDATTCAVSGIGSYSGTNINIPSVALGGRRVVKIGQGAFESHTNLTSVTIPDSVTSIYAYAFKNCSRLTSVTLSANIASIGASAFENCSSLTSIIIPDGVKDIYKSAFQNCSNLTNIILGNGVKSVHQNVFNGCSKIERVYYNGTEDEWSVNQYAGNTDFFNAPRYYYSETEPTTGNYWHYADNGFKISCTDANMIESKYFKVTQDGIVSAQEADITGTIHAENGEIGGWTINENFISKSVDGITSGLCSANRTLVKPTGLTFALNSDNAGYSITGYTGTDAEVIIPREYNGLPVTRIEAQAFKNNATIAKIVISDSITSIGFLAFEGCTNLVSVNIPSSATVIGDSTCYNCKNLVSVIIERGAQRIAGRMFYGCTSIKKIIIPDNITNIGDEAFYGCTNLASVYVPKSVTNIGSNAFYNCPENLVICYEGSSMPANWDASVPTDKIKYNCAKTYNHTSLAINGTTSAPRFFAGVSGSEVPDTSSNASFMVLEDGSLYASAAEIRGTIYADRGVFEGELKTNRGDIGGLNIQEGSISAGDGKLTFLSSGEIVANRLELNNMFKSESLKTSQISGQNDAAATLFFDETSKTTRTVKANVSYEIIDNGSEGFLGIGWKPGSVKVTVTVSDAEDNSITLFNSKTFEVVLTYGAQSWGVQTKRTIYVTVLAGDSSGSTVVDYRVGPDDDCLQTGVGYQSVEPSSYLEYTPGSLQAIKSSGSLIPTTTTGNLTLGDSSHPWGQVFHNHSACTSDRKVKNNIANIPADFSERLINGLMPKSYTLTTAKTPRTHYGFIAQDVEELLHSLGTSADEVGIVCKSKPGEPDSEDNHYSLNYTNLIAPMVSVIQQLSKRVEELENKLNTTQND